MPLVVVISNVNWTCGLKSPLTVRTPVCSPRPHHADGTVTLTLNIEGLGAKVKVGAKVLRKCYKREEKKHVEPIVLR